MIDILSKTKKLEKQFPKNEQELVELFMFKDLGPKYYGLRNLHFPGNFPDCVATRGATKIRI